MLQKNSRALSQRTCERRHESCDERLSGLLTVFTFFGVVIKAAVVPVDFRGSPPSPRERRVSVLRFDLYLCGEMNDYETLAHAATQECKESSTHLKSEGRRTLGPIPRCQNLASRRI